MRSGSYHARSDAEQPPFARRAAAFALAIAIELLLVAVLLTLGERALSPEKQSSLKTFSVSPSPVEQATRTPTKRKRAAHTAKAPTAAPPPPPQITPPPSPIPGLLVLDRNAYASSDIGKLPSHSKDVADAGQGDTSKDSVAAYGPGEGPGGQRLYDAEWFREPTHAELAFYLPAKQQEGWGLIACQTIPRNRVDNCRALGESPPGSGLARALREAAWQFQVLPPRIGGKPVIGAWVRIRFDLVKGVTK